jgi:hypothetical protein
MNEIVVNHAEQINLAHADALSLATGAKEQIAKAVERAFECGRLMVDQKQALQKQLGKERGGWLDWLEANCPDISEQTARRYMALFKRSHVSGYLEDCNSLRQAYLATGILREEPKPERAITADAPWVKFVKPLDKFRLWFNTRSKKAPMEAWGEDALRVLSNELQWFVNLHAEVQRTRQTVAEKDE